MNVAADNTVIVAANDNDAYRFYVYAWQYPDGRTFYIGKGQRGRDTREASGRNTIFKRLVAKIRREGSEPKVVRWQSGLREEDAHMLEVSYIKLFGRRDNGTGALVNLTDGGEGPSGFKQSPETIARVSAKKKGQSLSAEHRAKIAKANRGRKHSAESKDKISQAHRGKPKSEEHRAKMSAASTGNKHMLGKTLSEETRAKLSAAHSGRTLSKEHRATIGAANRLLPPRGVYKGVSLHTGVGKWRAHINIGGRQRFLGYHPSPEEAALAYDAAAIEAWGLGNCYLNMPDEVS